MTPTTPSSEDANGLGPAAVASPIDDLQSIAPLILNLSLREAVLARFDERRKEEAEKIFQCAGQLTAMTEWPEEHLLEALGCTLKTVGDFHDVNLASLRRCREFLQLVTRDAGYVDTVFDRRQVVVGSARLMKATGSDVDQLDALLKKKVGRYSAVDFLRLGEVDGANQQVRRLAGAAGTGETVAADDPFADAAPVHLSTTRIDMLIRKRDDLLGGGVVQRMRLHIEECDGCEQAYNYRLSHLVE